MSAKKQFLDEIGEDIVELVDGLSSEQKKEVDIYFSQLMKEISPALDALDTISKDSKVMTEVKNALKEEIKEQEWLEKLSKTFYHPQNIPDPAKTQKE